VLPLLAGCSDRSTLLKDLSDELSRVLMAPGRRVQSLAASAQEAWVKLYKATAVSADSQISYYRLGAATAFCLDVRLRQRDSSLAEQLRALWMTHGTVGRGFVRRGSHLCC
jgi:predicted metalloprotease with PDZ domain